MPKNCGHGQSTVLTDTDYSKLLKQIENPKHKLLIQIARYTGERWGSICQLQVSDIYSDAPARKLHSHITFRAVTRKADPNGHKETRQVHICESLATILRGYPVPAAGWLFPNRLDTSKHFGLKNADNFLRIGLAKAGLDNQGISSHSTRRTLITTLARGGVSAPVIQRVTGHKNLAVLQRYIDVSEEQVEKALALV